MWNKLKCFIGFHDYQVLGIQTLDEPSIEWKPMRAINECQICGRIEVVSLNVGNQDKYDSSKFTPPMEDIVTNFRKITGHVYKVENQNGFNAALYSYFDIPIDNDPKNHKRKREIRSMVQTWPTKYPTYIVIVDRTFEHDEIYIEHFNKDNL